MIRIWFRRRKTVLAIVAVTLLFTAWPRAARAQQDRSFSPQLFHPAPGPDVFITVEAARPLRHKVYGLGLYLNWSRNPFSILSYDAVKRTTTGARADLIENAFAADVWAAFGIAQRLQIALAWPMTIYQNGENFDDRNPPPDGTHVKAPSGFALGDPRLHIKGFLYGKARGLQVALSYWQGFPFGNDKQFGGERHFSGFSGEPRLLVGWEGDRWRVGAFLGFLWRGHVSQFFSTVVGNQLTYGGALAVDVLLHRLTLIVELYGHSNSIDTITVANATGGTNSITDINDNPLELDVAARWMVRHGLGVHLGVGNGLVAGLGAPAPRLFAGVVWAPDFSDRDKDGIPDAVDACPDEPEDKDGFRDQDGCPDRDNDADGVDDALDKCPNQPEDFDQFQDDDGCPEGDNDRDGIDDLHDACPLDSEDGKGPKPNDGCPASRSDSDGDGVPDSIDRCPSEPEDRDGFEDGDGCPDPDNDGDGIPDAVDKCPNAPEDVDGFEDQDGCPDPDNDRDGIPDAADKCPNEPETLNGVKDDDGCPDAGAAKVTFDPAKKQIVLGEPIVFDTDKATLKKASFALIDLVAQLLRGHGELKIEIQGHTEAQPDLERSIVLSKQRAEAVRAYLVQKGIDPNRLVAGGYGSTVPIADNNTKAGRDANRRIELHVIAALPPPPKANQGE
jgi:outer membrane protein OmpA-like peptidoglycan-associated protein